MKKDKFYKSKYVEKFSGEFTNGIGDLIIIHGVFGRL